jgi:hypothetical protein
MSDRKLIFPFKNFLLLSQKKINEKGENYGEVGWKHYLRERGELFG